MNSVEYSLEGRVATIRIDDGKRNALSPQVLSEIYAALDRAESDHATVILTGRESVFSAGFDLNVMKRGGVTAIRMLRSGYALTARVMAYPYPVIAACNGHAFAMGVYLMLSADYMIGTRGDVEKSIGQIKESWSPEAAFRLPTTPAQRGCTGHRGHSSTGTRATVRPCPTCRFAGLP